MDEISPTARTLDLVNNNIEIDLEDKLVSVPELLGWKFKEAWILGDGDPATTSCLYQCEMFLILDLIGGAQLQLSQLPQLSLALPWFLQTDIHTGNCET